MARFRARTKERVVAAFGKKAFGGGREGQGDLALANPGADTGTVCASILQGLNGQFIALQAL
jgi:hypothetical protein